MTSGGCKTWVVTRCDAASTAGVLVRAYTEADAIALGALLFNCDAGLVWAEEFYG